MRRTLRLAVALLLAAVPGQALAQTTSVSAAPLLEKEAPVDEVERGFYLGADVGVSFLGGLPSAPGTPSPSSWGMMLRLEAGYDIGRYFTVSLFGAFAAYGAGSEYIGYSEGAASGAFTQLIPGLAVRFFQPQSLFTATPATSSYSAFYAFAGVGVQYYTHLRHFSFGLEVDASFLGKSNEWGFQITPNIRYAF